MHEIKVIFYVDCLSYSTKYKRLNKERGERTMKKILIIAYYYPPQNNGGIQRILSFQKYLPRYGYHVDIVTTDIEGEIAGEKGVFRFADKRYNITRNSCKLFAFSVKAFFRFFVWLGIWGDVNITWKKEILKEIHKRIDMKSYDYLLASYPPEVDLEVGRELSEKYGISLIVDYRDGFMFEPFGILVNSPFKSIRNKAYEKKIAKHACLQIVVNKEIGEYYRNLNNTKTVEIPNGFDDEEDFPESDFFLPKGFNIIYTGAISLSRKNYGIQKITRIIQTNPNSNFVFIGRYSEEEKKVLQKNKNVYVYDQMERKKIIPIQRKADILMHISGEISSGTSGKIYEYMFAHKPILNLGTNNAGAKILRETNSGKTFLPDELVLIHNFIEDVKSHSISFSFCGLEKYTRREECKKLANLLDKMYDKP